MWINKPCINFSKRGYSVSKLSNRKHMWLSCSTNFDLITRHFAYAVCEALRDQTVHYVHCKRIPIRRWVCRNLSKTDLLRKSDDSFFRFSLLVLDFIINYKTCCSAQKFIKNRPVCGILNSHCCINNSLWNLQTNDKTFALLNWAVADGNYYGVIRYSPKIK